MKKSKNTTIKKNVKQLSAKQMEQILGGGIEPKLIREKERRGEW